VAAKRLSHIADRDEILVLLTAQARNGHVGAMRLLLQELRIDGDQGVTEAEFIDELARKREAEV
jgi:hypothetical protein